MSDYHIRESSINKKTVSTVFHIPIPIGNNAVGVAWRAALVEHLGGADAITSVLLDITPADLTAMKAGELFEHVTAVRFSSRNLTDSARLNEIKAAYTEAQTHELTNLQMKLKYYGYGGDI